MATILVVDDSTTMRQMVNFTLSGAGHKVVEAVDGDDALKVAEGKSIDLVITDINMPKVDGIALIKRLRSMPSFKFTPILTLTTESQEAKKLEGKAAGATGWIVKPFNPESLLSVLNKVLS